MVPHQHLLRPGKGKSGQEKGDSTSLPVLVPRPLPHQFSPTPLQLLDHMAGSYFTWSMFHTSPLSASIQRSRRQQKEKHHPHVLQAMGFVTKQPQVPQPLPISLVPQTLPQLHCSSLDTLQPLNVFVVVRGSKLNTGFEVRPHQCRVQGDDHCPSPAGHTIPDTSQDAIGFLGHLGTLLAHIQAAVNQHAQVLFHQAAFQPLFPKPVALHGVVVTQVQDPTLGLVEPHTIDLGPSMQPVQIPL
ncbi:hypothetical protein QYF61_021551 [Mycteria americana]|uniref:Uncharacterized protein n=1 Tax=Mycteria americana TaxID=33587 RepID=A0AAN7PKY0_MYCAM|nr:hypothetical protein QYF61_021551 [Mycteria americana]